MHISTIRAILKKLQATGTVTTLPGREPMFILPSRTVKRMKHFWRITEESSILGSPSLQNYQCQLFGRHAGKKAFHVIAPQT